MVSTDLKNMFENLEIFPTHRVQNKKYLKPPPSWSGKPENHRCKIVLLGDYLCQTPHLKKKKNYLCQRRLFSKFLFEKVDLKKDMGFLSFLLQILQKTRSVANFWKHVLNQRKLVGARLSPGCSFAQGKWSSNAHLPITKRQPKQKKQTKTR